MQSNKPVHSLVAGAGFTVLGYALAADKLWEYKHGFNVAFI